MLRWTIMTTLFLAAVPAPAVHARDESPKPESEETHRHNTHSQEATSATSRPAAGRNQRTCPVSGNPVNLTLHAEYEGRRVYFCSDECIATFTRSPEKHLPAVYVQLYPQRIQVRCPVTGNPIDSDVFTDHAHQRVYFCCPRCVADFEAAPKTYLSKMGEVSTEQVHCPVSGHLIDPQVGPDESLRYVGHPIYYCCEGCVTKMKSDPRKYVGNLRAQAGLLAYGATSEDDLLICLPDGDIRRRAETTTVVHDGIRYALSDRSSVKVFEADFDRFARLLRAMTIELSPDRDTLFSCRVHPTIIRQESGTCPLCGKELERVESKG